MSQFIDTNLGGDPVFGWWSNAALQPKGLMEELNDQLVNVTSFDDKVLVKMFGKEVTHLTFGYGSAAKIAEIMYKGTKVSGVWEKVPEKFRGVFWMKGNGIGEELTVMQFSTYFPEDETLLVPMAPFMWGWPGGKPAEAPHGGVMYSIPEASALVLTRSGTPGVAYSYIFEPCPKGQPCTQGSADLSFASLQGHPHGDLTQNALNVKDMIPTAPKILEHVTGKFNLAEKASASVPGSEYRRECFWGVGSCQCVEFGSYDLVKIIDSEGAPVEPFYSEFLAYMGDVPLFVWSGYRVEEP